LEAVRRVGVQFDELEDRFHSLVDLDQFAQRVALVPQKNKAVDLQALIGNTYLELDCCLSKKEKAPFALASGT